MFSKLKEKLKGALSIFSKKAAEEAEVKEIVVEKEIIVEKVPEKKTPLKAKEIIKEEAKEKEVETKEKKTSKVEKKKAAPKEPEQKQPEIPSDQVKITYFVHGTTTDNEQDIATGWNPGELSEKGIKESKELWEKIKHHTFEKVFCSDLKRSLDSAELTFGIKAIILPDQRLREANYGDFTGKKTTFKDKLHNYVEKKFPSGESYIEVEQRIADFLNYIYEKYRGKHIAIVAHQAPQLAMDVLLKGKTWQQAIAEDWRKTKSWQPGWEYTLKGKIEKDYYSFMKKEELPQVEKKGFFGKIKQVFSKKEEMLLPLEKHAVAEKESQEEKEAKEEKEKQGLFTKIKQTLTTKTITAEKFEELFWDLELALLENNVSVEVIEKIKHDLTEELVDKPLPRDVEAKILDTLKKTLDTILTFEPFDFSKITKKPFIIAFFGINGAGKTTSIAKLTHHLQSQGKSAVLAACDTFRAAAIQQLEEHALKLGVKIIKHDYGADAAAVAYDAVKYAEKNNIDVVMIDTAGRLHSNVNLMAELEKIIRIAKPDLKIFVGESITGNDCIEQARQFQQLVDLDGVILTKADVDEKGGAPLSIAYTIQKPIFFLGMGQKYEDLEVFEKEKILARLGL